MRAKFELSKQQRDDMAASIQQYFLDERGEEIGELAGTLILDFIIEKIAPVFYNVGVEDSHAYMTEKMDDLFGIMK